MRINVGGDGDVGVAHQLLGHVDGHPRPLQVGAEGVAQTVRGQVRGDGMLDDLAALDLGPQAQVQVMGKGLPQPPQTAGPPDPSADGGKDRVLRVPLDFQQPLAQLLAHGDVPDPRRGSWAP